MIGYRERDNIARPWRGFSAQIADTRLPGGLVVDARNISVLLPGGLRPARGWYPSTHDISSKGVPVEGLWTWQRFGEATPRLMIANSGRFWYADGFQLRTGLTSSVVLELGWSEDLPPTVTSWTLNRGVAAWNDDVYLPPDACVFGRNFYAVNGWDENQAFRAGTPYRNGLAAMVDEFEIAAGPLRVLKAAEIPWIDWDTYKFSATLSTVVLTGPGPGPKGLWRIYARYYNENTGAYGDPGKPGLIASGWPTLPQAVGTGPSVQYYAYGSTDPQVTHIHWFRTTRSGTQAYGPVAISANPGTHTLVTSPADNYEEEQIPGLQRMNYDNGKPPIGHFIKAHRGRTWIGGGVEVDVTGITAALVGDDETVTFSAPLLNDSMVGVVFRFAGGERIFTLASVVSSTVGELTEQWPYADNATAAVLMEGTGHEISFSEAFLPESHPLRNRIRIWEDSASDGPIGEMTGFGEHDDVLLFFFKRSVWALTYSEDPMPGRGAQLTRIAGTDGCVSHRTCVRLGALTYWLGDDAVYAFDGRSAKAISDGYLATWLRDLDRSSLPFAWAVPDRRNRQILFGVRRAAPNPSRNVGWPDTILEYNYANGDWTYRAIDALVSDPANTSWEFTAACLFPDANGDEQVVIGTNQGTLILWGRGHLGGIVSGTGFALEGTVDSVAAVAGDSRVTIASGALPTAPGLAWASYVEFLDPSGVDIHGKVPIKANAGTTFDISGTVIPANGDTYRIGAIEPRYVVLVKPEGEDPTKTLSRGKQVWYLALMFEVNDGAVLCGRMIRNGVAVTDGWQADDQWSTQGWRVLASGTLEVDMGFTRRSGEIRTIVQVPVMLADLQTMDTLHIEFFTEGTDQDWTLTGMATDSKRLKE